jgi:hypothetical protein
MSTKEMEENAKRMTAAGITATRRGESSSPQSAVYVENHEDMNRALRISAHPNSLNCQYSGRMVGGTHIPQERLERESVVGRNGIKKLVSGQNPNYRRDYIYGGNFDDDNHNNNNNNNNNNNMRRACNDINGPVRRNNILGSGMTRRSTASNAEWLVSDNDEEDIFVAIATDVSRNTRKDEILKQIKELIKELGHAGVELVFAHSEEGCNNVDKCLKKVNKISNEINNLRQELKNLGN